MCIHPCCGFRLDTKKDRNFMDGFNGNHSWTNLFGIILEKESGPTCKLENDKC